MSLTQLLPQASRPWGYGIYRTVYTPESNTVWDSVIEKLESYMRVWAGHEKGPVRNFQRCDRTRFDSATIDQVRNAFRHEIMRSTGLAGDDLPVGGRKVHSRNTPEILRRIDEDYGGDDNCMYFNAHHQGCIMIDEEVLQSILQAPSLAEAEAEPGWPFERSVGHVKIVKADKPDLELATYDGLGWLRVDLSTLGEMYFDGFIAESTSPVDPQTGAVPITSGFSYWDFSGGMNCLDICSRGIEVTCGFALE